MPPQTLYPNSKPNTLGSLTKLQELFSGVFLITERAFSTKLYSCPEQVDISEHNGNTHIPEEVPLFEWATNVPGKLIYR